MMIYNIKQASGLGTSLFISVSPDKDMGLEEIIDYLKGHPNDKFMISHLLNLLQGLSPQRIGELIDMAKEKKIFFLLSSLYQVCYFRYPNLLRKFADIDMATLAKKSPLVYIKWLLDKELNARLYWMEVFFRNKYNYELLPSLEDIKYPIPFDKETLNSNKETIHIRHICSRSEKKSLNVGTSLRVLPPEETIRRVSKEPIVKEMFIGNEKEVRDSVSPYAFKRDFKVDVRVWAERNRYKIKGKLTSRGKGKDKVEAKASYLMEFIERYSASASLCDNKSIGYKREFELVKAKYSDLKKKGLNVLDPNKMNLEVPYEDEYLYWVCADEVDKSGIHKIYVPAQFVFWLSSENLDEIDLLSRSSSNGLASGNTMDEAKLHGILEYIERHLDKVSCYCPSRCFSLIADGPEISFILKGLRERDIYIYFLDLTNEWGIPCYKAFIKSMIGETLITSTGCGAHLDGRIAALRALCELTHSSSYGPLIQNPEGLLKAIKTIRYEELPNYSSGNVTTDLHTLERLLIMNGLHIIYADLTRKDLDIPVVRVIIPGLEILPELNLLSNFNKELFRNYLMVIKERDESVDRLTKDFLKIEIPHAYKRIVRRYTNSLARMLGPSHKPKIEGYLKKTVKEVIEKMRQAEEVEITQRINRVLMEIKKILEEENKRGSAKEALNLLISQNMQIDF